MPRIITYEEPKVQAQFAELVHGKPELRTHAPAPRKRRRLRQEAEVAVEGGAPQPAVAEETPPKDDYLTKIVKYVPAETITTATLMFAAFKPTGNTVWVYLAVGSVANILYLLSLALGAPTTKTRPRWFFYLLSVGAFWLWALATIDAVREKAHITGDNADVKQAAILAGAAFIIPALDTIFANVSFPKINLFKRG